MSLSATVISPDFEMFLLKVTVPSVTVNFVSPPSVRVPSRAKPFKTSLAFPDPSFLFLCIQV